MIIFHLIIKSIYPNLFLNKKYYNSNFFVIMLFFYSTDLIFFCIIGIRFIEIIAIIIIGNINQVPISIFLPIRIRLYTSPILIRGGTFSFINYATEDGT